MTNISVTRTKQRNVIWCLWYEEWQLTAVTVRTIHTTLNKLVWRQRQPVTNNVMQWLFTRRCFLFIWSPGQRHAHSPHSQASSSSSSSSSSKAVRQRRRLRRQNALTRASVKLSDKLVRETEWERDRQREEEPHRIGIQQRVVAKIGLLAPEWATQPANGQRQCYKKTRFGRLASGTPSAQCAACSELAVEYKFSCRLPNYFLQRLFP